MKELCDQLREEVESYCPDADIHLFVDFPEKITGFDIAKKDPVEVSKSTYNNLDVLPILYHKTDESLDKAMTSIKEEISDLRFLRPIKNLYWRKLPTIVKDRNYETSCETSCEIYIINCRIVLGFDEIN